MKFIICDDSMQEIDLLKGKIKEYVKTKENTICEISGFCNIDEFFGYLNEKELDEIDAIFMDIEWEQNESGIDHVSKLCDMGIRIPIIYITAFTLKYVEDLFSDKSNTANVIGFLKKPVEDDSLALLMEKLDRFNKSSLNNKAALIVKQGKADVKVFLRDILYLESNLHSVIVHTIKEDVKVHTSMKAIRDELTEDFVVACKGYVVNLAFVSRIENKGVELADANKTVIPLGRTRDKEFRKRFYEYMGRGM